MPVQPLVHDHAAVLAVTLVEAVAQALTDDGRKLAYRQFYLACSAALTHYEAAAARPFRLHPVDTPPHRN